MGKLLTKKPLVEAIFELRWGSPAASRAGITLSSLGQYHDPEYQMLFARLADDLNRQGYKFKESLPATELPASLSGHIIQYRFRTAKDEWPLVQLGNGILTVNDVENYNWDDDFLQRCIDAVEAIHKKYPNDFDAMPRQSISLKYIDAYPFDYSVADLFKFLDRKMSLKLDIPSKLLNAANVSGNPSSFLTEVAYELSAPVGRIRFRIGRGTRDVDKRDLLIWETEVLSEHQNVPRSVEGARTWLVQAHDVTSKWFFQLIAGDLEKEFL